MSKPEQAFPCPPNAPVHSGSMGMTLRDYMAIHASDADVSKYLSTYSSPMAKTRQQARYMHADSMLVEREK